ncbi:endonuclease/exonuclease/phosphatase family protein [Litoribacter populi]|uniref:endonuclease/exonuclease/phosphatase family protein n=1 Tax=Litoribacter populi TaxID=2598460 RepID=UPI001180E9E9|nr:endonuclease/exonuclease/phosphatase family protein [Litoribacter populi]
MRFITLLVFIISMILFFSVRISPEVLPYTGLLPLLIPAFLIFNIALLLLHILRMRIVMIVPIIALAIGYNFLGATYQLNPAVEDAEGLSVMSYNVRLFNLGIAQDDKKSFTKNSIQWAREFPADIKCFQEFYQNYTIPTYNSIKQISQDGTFEYKYEIMEGDAKRNSYGLATFSRYPIINSGKVFQNRWTNGAIFTDIKINQDTIRVYNTHLESMNIKADDLNNVDGIKENYRDTFRKLKNGTEIRASQVQVLQEHISNSPHPVIVAGDFNDLPYSFTYQTLKKELLNAFEEGGRGFGFTFNRVLFFLRIDNIFYSPIFQIKDFNTHREVDYSDHYPVSAVFSWESPFPQKTFEETY